MTISNRPHLHSSSFFYLMLSASRCSVSICLSYSAHMLRISSSCSSLLWGRGGGSPTTSPPALGGKGGGGGDPRSCTGVVRTGGGGGGLPAVAVWISVPSWPTTAFRLVVIIRGPMVVVGVPSSSGASSTLVRLWDIRLSPPSCRLKSVDIRESG